MRKGNKLLFKSVKELDKYTVVMMIIKDQPFWQKAQVRQNLKELTSCLGLNSFAVGSKVDVNTILMHVTHRIITNVVNTKTPSVSE